jgi:hypothetical protein
MIIVLIFYLESTFYFTLNRKGIDQNILLILQLDLFIKIFSLNFDEEEIKTYLRLHALVGQTSFNS